MKARKGDRYESAETGVPAVIMVLANLYLSPFLGTAVAQDLPVLAHWWRAEPTHAGTSTRLWLHLEEGQAGELAATLVLPGETGSIPLGPATVTSEGVQIRGFELACEEDCRVLSAVLPDGLVPRYEIPVRFERAGQPGESTAEAAREGTAVAPEPLWTTPLDGAVWAPLAVDEATGLVFIATDAGRMVALSSANGRIAWEAGLDAGVRAEPTIAGDSVYVHSDAQTIYRLDAATGRVLWSHALGAAPVERLPPNAPGARWDFYASAVAVAGDVLVVGTRAGSVHALAREDGAELWRLDAGDAVTGTPLPIGDRVLFGTLDGHARAVALADGAPLWNRDLGGGLPADPALVEGLAWFGSRAYEILALDPTDGATRWSRYLWFSWIDSTPAARDGVAYIGSSDALRVLALDPTDGHSLWEAPVPGWAWARPAVTDSTVLAGTVGMEGYMGPRRGSLVALDRSSGAVRWRLELPPLGGGAQWGVASAPAALGDRLFAATLGGTLYAFPE